MTELEIFRNPEWLIGFLVISLVGSFARIAVSYKYTPKDFTMKNFFLQFFFGLVICFTGEILLKTFNYVAFCLDFICWQIKLDEKYFLVII